MKQILQDLSKGLTYIEEAPAPKVSNNSLLVKTEASLISAGTERMLVDFGRSSLIQKAKQQPEKVKQVIDKARTDGIATTIDAVRSKLAQPIPLGYCNVGTVVEVGSDVIGFKDGDRVLSNGPHADIVRVPQNLCAKVPENVASDAATFSVSGAIALQGIRIAKPTLGESFAVIGVGLIGLLAVQLLRAQGCRVLAFDFDEKKLALARNFGAMTCNPGKAEDPISAGVSFSRGRGVDGVIVTASTSSSDPISQAARMSRKRGRIVLVGVTGLDLNRSDFYEKELSFQVSCSYGPGRYDKKYESMGQDYPIGFVRWTAQRNFEAVLDLLSNGQVDVSQLITHRIPFEEAPNAYDILTSDKSVLGLLLEYPNTTAAAYESSVELPNAEEASTVSSSTEKACTFIGAGNYASRVLMPAFRKAGGRIQNVVTSSGTSAVIHGKANRASSASTDIDNALADPSTDAIVIATQHDTHASIVQKALKVGKHVFVEKPLALDLIAVEAIETLYNELQSQGSAPKIMVGFNRRFAPHSQKIKKLLASQKGPKAIIATVNAGAIPAYHWTQDEKTGGGRIVGEACHFIDLIRYYTGSPITSIKSALANPSLGDIATITLRFKDGSIGTVHYFANGNAAFPKERIEVFCEGKILQLDNFRKLRGLGWKGFQKLNLWRQDKGQVQCAQSFLDAIQQDQQNPIPFDEIMEVSRASIEAAQQAKGQRA